MTRITSNHIVALTSFVSIVLGNLLGTSVCYSRSEIVQKSYIGMHMHRVRSEASWPNIPFGSWRLWDAYVAWPDLEPQRGKWNFTLLDSYVALARNHNVNILLTLGMSPIWASSRPDMALGYKNEYTAEPQKLDDWIDYVNTVASRYKGVVREFEIWNEPNLKQYYTGDVATMVSLARAAYMTIKKIDPLATVVSPSATGQEGISWLANYLSLGGGDYCDVVGFHFYMPKDKPEHLQEFIDNVKKVMTKYGVDKPLWNTETGWLISDTKYNPKWMSSDWKRVGVNDSASLIARAFILSAGYGLERFYWYAWDNKDTGIVSTQQGIANYGGNAFYAINEWLVGHTIDNCKNDKTGIWSCNIYENNKKFGKIIWSPDNKIVLTGKDIAGYTIIEYLDGSATTLNDKDKIIVDDKPIMLKLGGILKKPRDLPDNEINKNIRKPVIIDKNTIVNDVMIIK